MARAQILLWTIAFLASAAAFTLATHAGFTIDYLSLLPFAGLMGLLIAILVIYTWIRPVPLIATLVGTQAATLWALVMIGMTALAGLGTGAPLVDSALIGADAALGLSARTTLEWFSDRPMMLGVLSLAYQASIPSAVVSIIALCLSSHHQAAWRVSACLTGSGLVCVVVAAFLPAIGAFPAFDIPSDTLARLPSGSGTYHLTTFEALRGGQVRHLDISMLNGVVTFPSFHAGMAMAVAHAGLHLKPLRLPATILAMLMMVSTLPIGGHYHVDVLAGIVIYLAFAGLLADRRSPSPRSVAPSFAVAGRSADIRA